MTETGIVLPSYRDLLRERGLITDEQLAEAEAKRKIPFELCFISQDDHFRASAETRGNPWIDDLLTRDIPQDVLARVTSKIAHSHLCLPLYFDPKPRERHPFLGNYKPGMLGIVAYNSSLLLVDNLQVELMLPVRIHVARESDLRKAIRKHYGPKPAEVEELDYHPTY